MEIWNHMQNFPVRLNNSNCLEIIKVQQIFQKLKKNNKTYEIDPLIFFFMILRHQNCKKKARKYE